MRRGHRLCAMHAFGELDADVVDAELATPCFEVRTAVGIDRQVRFECTAHRW